LSSFNSNFISYCALALMFFGSGFCGLLYQTIWLRLAFGHFGVISPVVSVILSTFMVGLAIGSYVSGKYVSAWKSQFKCSALLMYGIIELIIGLSAFAVPPLLHFTSQSFLQLGDANSFTFLSASAVGIFISILPWTIAMGMTYPLVLSFIDEIGIYDARSFGVLYTANTIGAIAGSVIPVFILVEMYGFRHTLWCGAAINFAIAVVAILWGLRKPKNASAKAVPSETATPEEKDASNIFAHPKFGYITLFTTGFCCMAMEVVWVRAFSPVLFQAVYAFAFLIACYLTGNAFGAGMYSVQKDQRKIVPIGVLLAATCITATFPLIASCQWIMTAIANALINNVVSYIAISISLVAFVLGYLTPNVIEQLCRSNPEKLGRAYAINIVGCTLGPLVSGYLLLPYLGVRWSLILLLMPLFLLMLNWQCSKALKFGSLLACAAIIVITNGYTWEEGAQAQIINRDYVATTIPCTIDGKKRLLVNGNCMTTISPITRMMAHFTFSLHKTPPKDVLIICFGMGQSFQSSLSWKDTNVTVVELVPGVVKSFPYFSQRAEQLLRAPRATIVIDDGRRFLSRTTKKFDVILIDPPPPPAQPGSSLLYSKEFYSLIKAHLKPDGIFQQWWGWMPDKFGNMNSMMRSVEQSFPYVRAFKAVNDPDKEMDGYHLICSLQPVENMTLPQFLQRMPLSAQEDMQELSKAADPKEEMNERLKEILGAEHKVSEFLVPNPRIIITDDHPYNEYFLLRTLDLWHER
jgi:spermidine synthase